jgi:chromatin remodeling complex protein RSC6
MVRKTKSTESTTTTTPAVTVTVEAVPAAAAAAAAPAEKKQRKPKAAAVTPVVEAPVAAPAEEQVAASAAAADASTLSSKLSDFSSKIQQVTAILSTMKTDYKVLEKSVSRELKNASKSKRSKKAPNPNRQPSGFVKPSVISDELIKFLGKETGTMMSRVEVSKEINAYITANQLKDKVSGRQINPDAKLAKLLKVGKDEVLTYFNLQKYLKVHFIKAVAPASA